MTREKVSDIGPLEITADKTRTFQLSLIAGDIALDGGIALFILEKKKEI